jgi:chromosome segregation ATPase
MPSLSPPAPTSGESAVPGFPAPAVPPTPLLTGIPEADAMLSLLTDPSRLQDDHVMQIVAELGNLRREMRKTESDLVNLTSKLDTDLLNLRNLIQVKRMMYDTLQQQVRVIKQEWSEAYDEYQRTEQQRRTERAAMERQIDDLRKRIEKGREALEKRIHELERETKRA